MPAAEGGQKDWKKFGPWVGGCDERQMMTLFRRCGLSQQSKRVVDGALKTRGRQRVRNRDIKEVVTSRCAHGLDIRAGGGRVPWRAGFDNGVPRSQA